MIEHSHYLVGLIAMGAALLLLAQVAAGEPPMRLRAPLVALILGAVAAVLSALPWALRPGPHLPLIDLVALALPYAIWWLGRALLSASLPRGAALALGAIGLGGWSVGHFVPGAGPAAFGAVHLVALGLAADLARAALGERKRGDAPGDPLGEREGAALWLAGLGAALALQRAAVTLAGVAGEIPAALQLAGALIVLVLILVIGLAFVRIDPAVLDARTGADRPVP